MPGGEVRPGRREGLGCGGGTTSGMHVWMWPDSRLVGAKGTRGAHDEHVAHVCDAGGVEAQRLVEGRRELPSRKEGGRGISPCMRGDARAASRGCTGRDREARSVQARGHDYRLAGRGARGAARLKHVFHVQDAGGVKAQGLVEGQRGLPRVASRAHGAERAAGREAGGGKRARLAHAAGRVEGWTVQISGAKRAGSSLPESCSASPSRVRCSSSAAG